eukprot:scaffold20476_cov35-Attheya_sp.AAC.1
MFCSTGSSLTSVQIDCSGLGYTMRIWQQMCVEWALRTIIPPTLKVLHSQTHLPVTYTGRYPTNL